MSEPERFAKQRRLDQANGDAPKLPQSPEAERAVLSCILLDNGALSKVAAILTPDDFFLPNNVRVFSCMLEMVAAKLPIDLVTVVERLDRRGDLVAAGGAPYLASLIDPLFQGANVASHARIVKEKSIYRKVIYAAYKVSDNAFAQHISPADVACEAAAIMKDIEGLAPAKDNDWRTLFHTFEEFESAPPLSFLIEGFLQRQGINGLAALAESGKTFMALSIAKALLFGPGKLWDLFKVNGRAERVLYLIPESSLIPIKHRIRIMGLYEEIEKRLFLRTISKGDTPELSDPLLLEAVSGADLVILDTSVRFMGRVADDSSAMSVAAGLSNDLLKLMRVCPGAILILYHSQKGSRQSLEMNLESMIRGSGELGAVLAVCFGVKQIDKASNTLHVQNIKARDFEACGPFQLIGRPYIDREGDFRLHKPPEDCGTLQEESPQAASNDKRHDGREDRVAMTRSWMNEEPNISVPELQTKFQALGITVKPDTVRRYQLKVRKG